MNNRVVIIILNDDDDDGDAEDKDEVSCRELTSSFGIRSDLIVFLSSDTRS